MRYRNAVGISEIHPRFTDGRPLYIGDRLRHVQFIHRTGTVRGIKRDPVSGRVFIKLNGYSAEFLFSEPRGDTHEVYWLRET